MIHGDRVDLRAVEPADYELLWQWLNDPTVTLYWGIPGNSISLPEVAHREEAEAKRGTSRKYIIQTKDGLPIGQIDYYDLDWKVRSASISIMIGVADYWGGGYGTDAMRALLRHLFDEMGLHRVSLNVHATNARAIGSYRKSGYRVEGTMRDWAYFNGRWVDGILMAVLEDDFREAMRDAGIAPM